VLLRPLLQALACTAVAAAVLPFSATPLRAAPSLQALQDALNSTVPDALNAVLETGEGLDSQQVERQRQLLRQQFPDASWSVKAGAPLRDGRATTELTVTGSRQQGPFAFRFVAYQQLVLGAMGDRFNRQEVIRENSLLRSGSDDLKVSLQIPDAVLTGQRYDLDVVIEDPLDGAVIAGSIRPVSVGELMGNQGLELHLEALGSGGLFKTVQAPYQPGTQTWAVLLVHPKGIVAGSKQVRVVADKAGLNL